MTWRFSRATSKKMDRPGEAFGPALEVMGDVGELYMVSVFVIARTEKRCLFEHARVISNYAKANNKATYSRRLN
jgi:hypothetical protein